MVVAITKELSDRDDSWKSFSEHIFMPVNKFYNFSIIYMFGFESRQSKRQQTCNLTLIMKSVWTIFYQSISF